MMKKIELTETELAYLLRGNEVSVGGSIHGTKGRLTLKFEVLQ